MRDAITPLTVNLVVDQCFVELRILREVAKKKKVRETVAGKVQTVEKDVLMPEEAVGATVTINDDPTSAQATSAGRWLSYDFVAGVYRIVARFEDLLAVHDLVVDNTAPKQIELMLRPRAEMEHALTAPLPEGPAPKTTAAAEAQTSEHTPLELEVTPELLGEDLPPLPDEARPAAPQTAAPRPSAAPSLLDPKSLPKRPVAPRMPRPRPPGESAVPSRMEIDELFEAVPENWQDNALRPASISETERLRALDNIAKLRNNGRYDEAAEICIRLGDYERAAELCQRGSNQELSYKVYGLNYLKQGAYREAAEMFKSAAEPLLLAQALEGLRLFDEANRQRGSYFEARGDIPRAVEFYEKAGAFDKVALLQERARQFAPAGEAYFKARLYAHAAECFVAANDPKRAAESYEMDAQFLKAADLYGKLGSHAKVCALYEKAGRLCEAAEGFKRLGLHDEAIHACQQVRPESAEYLKAALIMGTIFIERGEQTLARGVYHRVVENARIESDSLERYYEFGVVDSGAGQPARSQPPLRAFAVREIQLRRCHHSPATPGRTHRQ